MLEPAQRLAALKIHIDDLERGGRPRPAGSPVLPSFRLKYAMPSGALKGRDLKTVLGKIAEEYSSVCTLSVRDAKHAYLETAAVVCSYGCDSFYSVKEVWLMIFVFIFPSIFMRLSRLKCFVDV